MQVNEWRVAGLRMTLFVVPGTEIGTPIWWETVVGEPPENRSLQPREGGLTEEGQFAEGRLVLMVTPIRIDWLFNIGEQAERTRPFDEALGRFVPPMLRWLETASPPTQRLAFGGILMLSVDSREDGYRRLMSYLPLVRLEPEGSSDFLYQINRPRIFARGDTELRINRLTRWSVSSSQETQISLPQMVGYVVGPNRFSCRLELDINTDQNFRGQLPQEQLTHIFQVLVDFGREIAQRGDIS